MLSSFSSSTSITLTVSVELDIVDSELVQVSIDLSL